MRARIRRLIAAMALAPAAASIDASPVASGDVRTVYNFPRASHIVVDGNLDDWAGKGFHIEQLAPDSPNAEASDHAAWARIAWNRDSLLVAVRVWDDSLRPATEESVAATASLEHGDSIVVHFSPQGTETTPVNFDLGPVVASDASGQLQTQCCGAAKPSDAAFVSLPDGYAFEAAFPWTALGVEPRKGLQIGFQIKVRDLDPDQPCDCLSWRLLNGDTDSGTLGATRLRVYNQASPSCGLCMWEETTPNGETQLTVQAPIHHEGDLIAIRQGDNALAESIFYALPGGLISEAQLILPAAAELSPQSVLEIAIADEPPVRYRPRSLAAN